jgi:hypothetical protein
VKDRLAVFLDDISARAETRGAKLGDNKRAVVVVSPADEAGDTAPVAAVPPAEENANLDALAHSIADGASKLPSVVVVADAKYNSFLYEQTRIVLQPFDNKLVFPREAEIASLTVDGTMPEDAILGALQKFLNETVRPTAIDKGVIPALDPQTGELLVGKPIDSATWLALVKHIKEIGNPATITARAESDTYSMGPLTLDLDASRPGDSVTSSAANVPDKPR